MSLSTAASATTAATPAASATSTNALASISNNFNSFLGLLTTQLKNQDPTAPLDTNQFTQELVQFTSVEQQITTNSSLTSLIQATQGNEVINASTLVGKTVSLDTDKIALQNGTGAINYTTASPEAVQITVKDSTGATVRSSSVSSAAGSNTWTWDGKNDAGNSLADGAYSVAVVGAVTGGTAAAVPFTVTGTATGVTNTAGTVALQVGAVSADFSKIVAVANK